MVKLFSILYFLVLLTPELRGADEVPVFEDCSAEMITNVIFSEQVMMSYTGNLVEVSGGLISIQGGQVIYDKTEVPVLGDPEKATHVIAGIFDYTCSHCIKLRGSLFNIQRNYGDALAVVQLPGTRGTEQSRDMQKFMLVAFHADKPLYQKLANSLYFGQMKAEPAELEAILKKEWGLLRYKEHMLNYQDLVMDVLFRTRMVMEINSAAVGSMALPQWMLGNHIALGSSKDERGYFTLLKHHLDLDARFPVLQTLGEVVNLGRVFSGRQLGIEIPLNNKGNAPLILGQLVMPQGSKVRSHPNGVIHPGRMEKLSLSLSAPKTNGVFEQQVSLLMNTLERKHVVKFTGESWNPVRFNPGYVEFTAGTPSRKTVSVQFDAPVVVDSVKADHPSIQPAIRELETGTSYTLSVDYDPAEGVPLGGGVIYLNVKPVDSTVVWPPRIGIVVRFLPQT